MIQAENTSLTYSDQIGYMGTIDLSEDFSIERKYFLVKNDGEENVKLEVRLANMTEFVETIFAPGWNPELVSEIKKDTSITYDLKYGY